MTRLGPICWVASWDPPESSDLAASGMVTLRMSDIQSLNPDAWLTPACILQMSCRYTLDVLIAGEDAPFDRKRHLLETCLIVFGSLAVALAFPTGAEKIFAVTGRLTL